MDILLGGKRGFMSLEEFIKDAGVPLKDRPQIIRIIYDIICSDPNIAKSIPGEILAEVMIEGGPSKILLISRGIKKNLSLENLSEFVQNLIEQKDWVIIRYSQTLEQGVKSRLSNVKGLQFFDVTERRVSESLSEILLRRKRFAVTVKVQGQEVECFSMKQIPNFLRSYEMVEIGIPLTEYYKVIVDGVIKVAHLFGFRVMYDFDESKAMLILRLKRA